MGCQELARGRRQKAEDRSQGTGARREAGGGKDMRNQEAKSKGHGRKGSKG